ncbi:paramyosin-like isoform X1 [Iris pallida]|uniref:Paramyosin-like isoform X1 n=1 Tax=Iris pallida TaxID=29817 RepID=A0AAX6I9K3_IRIPA|nr:paramyosin-like isoform X1 [Iris pallida]
MFKAARWRSDKNKIKAAYRLQFHATQVHGSGREPLVVTLVPLELGKPTLRSEKAAAAADGECQWQSPVYETVRLMQDPKTGKISDKPYQFQVSTTGSAKCRVLGEATINLAEYFEAFKPSSVSLPLQGSTAGAILHVTVQRIQGDAEGRENDEDGDAKGQGRTLKSQLSFPENEIYNRVAKGANAVKLNKEGTFVSNQLQTKLHSSRNVLLHVDSGDNLTKSSSFDAISASGSESSSGQYTPKENGIKNDNSQQEPASILSPLSNKDTPRIVDWSVSSAPDESISGSINSSGETGLQEAKNSTESGSGLQKQKSDLNALARQLEVSDLELQTLRKQVVKESRRGQDISKELSSIKKERDALRRELEELKASMKRVGENESISARLQVATTDPWSLLQELKEELDHEKNLNANLRLQLDKTQESNSELIFAVRDLEELLERKNGEARYDTQEKESRDEMSHMSGGLLQESDETTSENEEEQYALDVLIKEHHDAKGIYSQEQMIIDLSSELELYKKDREDLEMQMEQLALDYEILKQEHHDISSRLEQIQLREQLRMQYECSAHLAIINDLEIHVESLEAELQKQDEVFEGNLATIIHEKVEQEQRAIESEEALRKTRWNSAKTAEQLQEEVRRLSVQMSSAFDANEKLVLETLTESRELHLQKSHLEDLLKKTNEELTSAKHQHHVKCQQLLSLIDFKTKEADRLYLELKDKREELENQRKSEVARQNASREEMLILKADMEHISRERDSLSEQIAEKEKQVAEIEELKASTTSTKNLLNERCLESDSLVKQLSMMKEEANKSLVEHSALRHLMDDQDETIKILKSEVENLRAQYTDLKSSLSDDELEKENLRKQVCLLRNDLQEEADIIASIEKKLKGNNAKLKVSEGTTKKTVSNKKKRSAVATRGSQEVPTLDENSELPEVNRLNGHGSNIHEGKQVESNMHNNLTNEGEIWRHANMTFTMRLN